MTEEELTGDWRDIYIRAYEHAAAERKALQQTIGPYAAQSQQAKELEAIAQSGVWYPAVTSACGGHGGLGASGAAPVTAGSTKQIKAVTVTVVGDGPTSNPGAVTATPPVTAGDQRDSSWYGLANGEAMILLAARAAELHKKAVQANIFDSERIKYGFAAREIEKLIEELKAL